MIQLVILFVLVVCSVFEMEAVKVFETEELAATKIRLSDFLFELALQLKQRLPDVMAPKKVLGGVQAENIQKLGAIAQSLCSFVEEPFDISVIEGEWRRLRNTTMDVNANSTSMDFWSAIAAFKNGDELLFPQLIHLAMILFCYPLSNATVECLFSVTSSVKSKLRNLLAVAMVVSI